MKQCPKCNYETDCNDDSFCAQCGTKLTNDSGKAFCRTCGAELRPNAFFCTKCGALVSVFGPLISTTPEKRTDASISITAGENRPPGKKDTAHRPHVWNAPILSPSDGRSDPGVSGMEAAPSERILTRNEIRMLGKKALKLIPERVAYYAPLVGVKYGRITVQNYKSTWGVCNCRGDLTFNSFLMLAPLKALDSVVVHELCHILQPNHTDRFYAEVLRVFPDYLEWEAWLNQNEDILEQMEQDYIYRCSTN